MDELVSAEGFQTTDNGVNNTVMKVFIGVSSNAQQSRIKMYDVSVSVS